MGEIVSRHTSITLASSQSVSADDSFSFSLAKYRAGYKPIAICGSKNFDLVKKLGAVAAFDYKDPQVSEKIVAWVKEKGYGPIVKAFDTISEKGSIDLVTKSMGEVGQVVTLRTSLSICPMNVAERGGPFPSCSPYEAWRRLG